MQPVPMSRAMRTPSPPPPAAPTSQRSTFSWAAPSPLEWPGRSVAAQATVAIAPTGSVSPFNGWNTFGIGIKGMYRGGCLLRKFHFFVPLVGFSICSGHRTSPARVVARTEARRLVPRKARAGKHLRRPGGEVWNKTLSKMTHA